MNKYLSIIPHGLKFLLLTIFFTSCYFSPNQLSNSINQFYQSPKAQYYSIKSIALLPMANDDTTDIGTYYSTNYFYNKLTQLPNISIIDIDKIIPSDSFVVSNLLEILISKAYIDVQALYETDLGKYLKQNNCDALIIGQVNNYNKYYNTWFNKFSQVYISNITLCNFFYCMISLFDGSIIWVADIESFEEYIDPLSKSPDDYSCPPIDEAISKGIDLLYNKLTTEFFKLEKVKNNN